MTNPDSWFVSEHKNERRYSSSNDRFLFWSFLVILVFVLAIGVFFSIKYYKFSCFSSLGPSLCRSNDLFYEEFHSYNSVNYSVICSSMGNRYLVWERVDKTSC